MIFAKEESLTMTITITAFERSPDGGKGLARDTRVRWALEEVGQSYEVRLVSLRAMKQPAHRPPRPPVPARPAVGSGCMTAKGVGQSHLALQTVGKPHSTEMPSPKFF
jgi:hypothetical protein